MKSISTFAKFPAFLAACVGVSCVSAKAQTWTGNTSNAWNNALNWTPNAIPNNNSTTATFDVSTRISVNLPAADTLQELSFTSGAPSYTFSGSNLTLDANSASASSTNTTTVLSVAGSNTQTFQNTVTVENTGSTGAINNTVSMSAGSTLNFTGGLIFAPVSTDGMGETLLQFNGSNNTISFGASTQLGSNFNSVISFNNSGTSTYDISAANLGSSFSEGIFRLNGTGTGTSQTLIVGAGGLGSMGVGLGGSTGANTFSSDVVKFASQNLTTNSSNTIRMSAGMNTATAPGMQEIVAAYSGSGSSTTTLNGSVVFDNGTFTTYTSPAFIAAANNTLVIGGEIFSTADATGAGLLINGTTSATSVGTVNVAGTGTVVLSYSGGGTSNQYTAPTTVVAGTLLVENNAGSATNGNQVTVNKGATLGGSGFLAPTGANGISIASGAQLAPGVPVTSGTAVSTHLTLSLSSATGNNLTFAVPSTALTTPQLTFQLGTGSNSINPGLTLAGSSSYIKLTSDASGEVVFSNGVDPTLISLDDITGGNLTLGGNYLLFQSASTGSGGTGAVLDYKNLTYNSTTGLITGGLALAPQDGSDLLSIDLKSGTGYGDIYVTVVPEPSTWAMLLTGAALLTFKYRRRLT